MFDQPFTLGHVDVFPFLLSVFAYLPVREILFLGVQIRSAFYAFILLNLNVAFFAAVGLAAAERLFC